MALEDKQLSSGEIDGEAVAEDQEEGLKSKPVDDLRLSVRARKCLQKLNIRSIGEITSKTDAELLGCKNFGVTSLNEVRIALTDLGLSLRSLD